MKLMKIVVAVVLAMSATVGLAPVASAHPVCDDYKHYSITSHSANHLVQTVPTVQLLNKGKTTATLGTTVTITGSVSLALSVSGGVDANFVVATVKGSITATATYTLTGSWATSASMVVRPGKVGYIKGGIFRVETTGTYEHVDQICRVYKTTETAYTPYRYGYITSGG